MQVGGGGRGWVGGWTRRGRAWGQAPRQPARAKPKAAAARSTPRRTPDPPLHPPPPPPPPPSNPRARTRQRGGRRDVEHGCRVLVEGADGGAPLADERAAQPRVHQHAQHHALPVLGQHSAQGARLGFELAEHEVQRGEELVDCARDQEDAVLGLGGAGVKLVGLGELCCRGGWACGCGGGGECARLFVA